MDRGDGRYELLVDRRARRRVLVDGVEQVQARGVEFPGAGCDDYADRRGGLGPFEGGKDIL